MLVSILANLVLEPAVVPPSGQHNVPDTYVEEKGGYGEKLKKEQDEGTRKVIRDDEEIMIILSQWIIDNNSN